MSKQSWRETLVTAQIDGTALGNTVTPTSIIPPAAVFTIPANFFEIGKKLNIRIGGRISNINPTPGTFTLDVRFGAIIAATSPALALNTAAAKTNVSFLAELELTCRAIGNSTTANVMMMGKIISESFALGATGVGLLTLPASAPAVGTGFDSTVAIAINVFGTWSVNNAGNTIQVHTYELESAN
jgi:hypothetical protein